MAVMKPHGGWIIFAVAVWGGLCVAGVASVNEVILAGVISFVAHSCQWFGWQNQNLQQRVARLEEILRIETEKESAG